MAEASRVLASSMDYAETLQRVARLAVPQIADWCAVDLLSERGRDRACGGPSRRPGRSSRWRSASTAHYRPALDEPAGVPEVIRSGRARIFTDIQPEALAAYARDPEHLRAAARDRRDRGDHRADGRRDQDDRGDHARLLRIDPSPLPRGSRARRKARPPRRDRRRKRSPLHRAHAHRPHPPARAAARVPARDPGGRDRGALFRGRRAERGRRRLLRRIRVRRRALDARDRRRLRQGPPGGRRDGAGASHPARRCRDRTVARGDARNASPRAAPPASRSGPLHRLPGRDVARARARATHDRARRTPAAAAHRRRRRGGTDRPSPARCSASSTRSTSTNATPSCTRVRRSCSTPTACRRPADRAASSASVD